MKCDGGINNARGKYNICKQITHMYLYNIAWNNIFAYLHDINACPLNSIFYYYIVYILDILSLEKIYPITLQRLCKIVYL